MMNTQEWKRSSATVVGVQALEHAPTESVALRLGQVVSLGKGGGDVEVLAGRVWLTRSGDVDDHVLGVGDRLRLGTGGALVESWSRGTPALIGWRPRSLLQRWRDRFDGTCQRCWSLMHPGGRVGMGGTAAVAAIAVAAALFGPVSESRVRALSKPPAAAPLLHNASSVAAGAHDARGPWADGSEPRRGPSAPAQEARRRAPGTA